MRQPRFLQAEIGPAECALLRAADADPSRGSSLESSGSTSLGMPEMQPRVRTGCSGMLPVQ